MSITFINLSGYRFVELKNLEALQQELRLFCHKLNLKGTILLSPEGINFFLAGVREATDGFLEELRKISGLEGITAKESLSDTQPFRRMLIKIKKEIIAFGIEGIDPTNAPTQKIAPPVLKKWLDEGRLVTLLDTRNDYEIRLGTFRGAVPAGINHFRKFPEAVKKMPVELKEQPLVMFCTGGIRCEKAGPFMEREGFKQVYQLEGGILDYFKECGGAHYDGECFVFDRRVGVDPMLQETSTILCFKCQMPLTTEDQADPRYVIEESCPFCFGREVKKRAPRPRKSRLAKKTARSTSTNQLT
ncbi:MAG: rhodanese-related sulfurtransferase [Chthoniobacterales bacterium]